MAQKIVIILLGLMLAAIGAADVFLLMGRPGLSLIALTILFCFAVAEVIIWNEVRNES